MLEKMLPRNEGTLDRVFRVVLGLAMIGLAVFGPQTPIGWIGVIPLVTGLIGSCPIYRILGISTCPLKQR